MKIRNVDLYEHVKKFFIHMKPSAYKSGLMVKKYKNMGGTFIGPKPRLTGLARWFAENWKSNQGKYRYTSKSSVYRPTRRITAKTPITFSELTKRQLIRAKREKAKTGHVEKFSKNKYY